MTEVDKLLRLVAILAAGMTKRQAAEALAAWRLAIAEPAVAATAAGEARNAGGNA